MLTIGQSREATTIPTPADSAALVMPLIPDVYASARLIAFVALDRIIVGRHEGFVVEREKFMARVHAKAAAADGRAG